MNSRRTSGNHDFAFFRRAAVAILVVAAATAISTTANAANTISGVCDAMADGIWEYAKRNRQEAVPIYVDPIALPPKYNSPGGEGIRITLRDTLKAKGLKVVGKSRQAKWFIRGECMARSTGNDLTLVIDVKDENGVSLDINQNLIQKFDQKGYQPPKKSMSELHLDRPAGNAAPKAAATLNHLVEVTRLKGFTGDLSTYVSKKINIKLEGTNYSSGRGKAMLRDYEKLSRTEKLKASDQTQKALMELVGTQIPLQYDVRPLKGGNALSASRNSLFELQLAIKDKYGGRPQWASIEPEGDFWFTQLKPDQAYVIAIKNRSDHDAGVVITVDGVNTLHFCKMDDIKKEGKYFVPKQQTIYVNGWLLDSSQTRDFLVVPEPEGVVAQEGLGSVTDVGMISAEFYYASTSKDDANYDMLMAGATRGPGQALATGLGPVRNEPTKMIPNVTFGKYPLALITLRYDRPEPPAGSPGTYRP